MQHSSAECTICAIKGVVYVTVMIFFRVQPLYDIDGQPFDNQTREEKLIQGKQIEDLDQIDFDRTNKVNFGADPEREDENAQSEQES